MNIKLQKALSEKCKDMGLSKKAIDRLAELAGEGLAEDASDEDIEAKAELMVPFAREMQAEVTRKSKKAQSAKPSESEGKGEGEDKGEEAPEWARQMQAEIAALRQENADIKAERAKADRAAQIADKAKRLGIPEFLMKRVSIADDADIDKELADYKQELVNNGLAPKEQAGEPGNAAKTLEAEADEWLRATYGVE